MATLDGLRLCAAAPNSPTGIPNSDFSKKSLFSVVHARIRNVVSDEREGKEDAGEEDDGGQEDRKAIRGGCGVAIRLEDDDDLNAGVDRERGGPDRGPHEPHATDVDFYTIVVSPVLVCSARVEERHTYIRSKTAKKDMNDSSTMAIHAGLFSM